MSETAPEPDITATELTVVADTMSARLGWLEVKFGPGPSVSGLSAVGLPAPRLRVGSILASQTGGDSTRWWREGLTAATRSEGVAPPPAYAASFVLQWALQLLAMPAAFLAAERPWILSDGGASAEVVLDPRWWSPRLVRLDARAVERVVERVPASGERWERAEAAYLLVAEPFARDYAPGVKMSSRQRLGMVRDVWRMARTEALTGVADPTPRESCCFIFVLPGANPCATCPRLQELGHSGRR